MAAIAWAIVFSSLCIVDAIARYKEGTYYKGREGITVLALIAISLVVTFSFVR